MGKRTRGQNWGPKWNVDQPPYEESPKDVGELVVPSSWLAATVQVSRLARCREDAGDHQPSVDEVNLRLREPG